MRHLADHATTIAAGAAGSAIAVLAIGASLALVLPVTLGVAAFVLIATRSGHASDS